MTCMGWAMMAAVWAGGGAAGALAQEEKPAPTSPTTNPAGATRLIIRLDDVGFCHAANMAAKRILDEGVCTSISVIVNTPWLDEAVELLRAHPEVSVGVHLTLNCEWREFRWGPVRPYTEVPSLVDGFGKFHGTRRDLMAQGPKTDEVWKELRAQIDLALRKGLKISYCDYHMGAALATREWQELVEQLADEYHIGISRYFGEKDTPAIYGVPPEQKSETGVKIIEGLTAPGLYLMVIHPGANTPEMAALTDLNLTGPPNMAAHRQAEADMLCNPAFRQAIRHSGIELIGYREVAVQGRARMQRPFVSDPYDKVVEQARSGTR